MMTISLALRPVTASDRPFLVDLYAESRAAELGLTDWTSEQQRAFVNMQFTAQDASYRGRCPSGSFDVVVVNDAPVGRLYVDRRPETLHVLDIALAPEWRQRGIGTSLIRALMDEAVASGRRVSLYVEMHNPARAWYERRGFVASEQQGVYTLMTWSAP